MNGIGKDEVITAPGPGGGPHVKVWNGDDGTLLHAFFAYDAGFTGGVYVGAGRVTGGGSSQVITGAGRGGGPEVRIFSVTAGAHTVVADFFCYDSGFTGGVRVGFAPALGDVICAPGPGYVALVMFAADPFPSAGEDVAAFDALGSLVFPNFLGGVFTSPN